MGYVVRREALEGQMELGDAEVGIRRICMYALKIYLHQWYCNRCRTSTRSLGHNGETDDALGQMGRNDLADTDLENPLLKHPHSPNTTL